MTEVFVAVSIVWVCASGCWNGWSTGRLGSLRTCSVT